jgi:hypothetical protein
MDIFCLLLYTTGELFFRCCLIADKGISMQKIKTTIWSAQFGNLSIISGRIEIQSKIAF